MTIKKNVSYYLALSMSLFLSMAAFPAAAQGDSDGELEKATNSLIEALLTADTSALSALVSNKLTYGHSSGKIENKSEFIQAIASGESVFEEIVLTEQTIRTVDKTGIVRHSMIAKTNDPEKGLADLKIGVLLTWVKEGENWKLLARQAYPIPV